MRRRIGIPAALGVGIGLLFAASSPRAGEESAAGILAMAERYAGLVRDTIPLLDRRPEPATIAAAVADTRRVVAEIDRLSANAAIFEAAPRERQQLQDLSAGAHLNLALFETYGLEFDRARQEIARARALSDLVSSTGFRTEWLALQSGRPGAALQTRYNLLTLAEFESALGSIWYRARPVSFEFKGYTTQDLSQIQLRPQFEPADGSLDAGLLLRGTAALRDALDKGKAAFAVPLPPGLYRLQGRAGGEVNRGFAVPEVTDVDAVYVDRARFALRIEPKPASKPPRFFLNGLEVTDLNHLPYGVYRLKADPDDYPGAPQVVRFVLGEGIPDKTRTSWTIFVPAGSPAVLQLDRGGPGTRRR